jgi:hypothetical protein
MSALADICSAKRHVRFTPNGDRKSGHLGENSPILGCKSQDTRDPSMLFKQAAKNLLSIHTIMELEQTEEEIILAFIVSDEALEDAANTNFSLGNCTEANVCPVPN